MTLPTRPTGDTTTNSAVLVVDDDDSVRQLLALALRDAGFDVVEVSDGRSALSAIAHGSFAVVLLDNRMPGMDGRDVLRVLRTHRQFRTLPVILVSGDSDSTDRLSGLEAGADDYVTKPFDILELVARVRAQVRSQTAWERAVDRQLRERAAVVTRLGAIVAEGPEDLAAAICAEAVVALPGIAGSAVVWFAPGELAVPLAVLGESAWGASVGEALPPPVCQLLRRQARRGPWLQPPGSGLLAETAGVGTGTLACVPLGRTELPAAVLLLVVGAPAGASDVGSGQARAALCAAIDIASVAEGLLLPLLTTRARQATDRRDVVSLVGNADFNIHFQPVVRLVDDVTVGYEALTRFVDGTSPELRFAEAATLGIGVALETATLQRALASAHDLPRMPWLGLNVSADLLREPATLGTLLDGNERDVVLELSEHDPIGDYGEVRAAVVKLGERVRLSVDDAGSGFASLRHIIQLKPAFTKLDRSWVHGIDTDPERQALIAGIGYFARQTGCHLIAEGIETSAERRTIGELGVELGQGYLLGRPRPAVPV